MPASEYELQMLLGVREGRASELVTAGHRLRVYVPFGQRWYEYSLRRLQENPAMATTIAKATVGRSSAARSELSEARAPLRFALKEGFPGGTSVPPASGIASLGRNARVGIRSCGFPRSG